MSQLYFDHNATTPLHPEVAEVMGDWIRSGQFGNPSSIHSVGRAARSRVEDARESVAQILGVSPSEIVFTSGGSEADNLAILGATASGKLKGRHLVVTSFEHPAVLESFKHLESEGWEVTWVDPDGNGIISPDVILKALRPNTGLVSVMAANNEVGTIQPVAAIGKLLHSMGIAFHCDAVQALGKIPQVRPRDWQVDFLTISAHKINGPKGVGALYVRKGAPLKGLTLGGPHERGFRAGTENVLGLIGFGKAADLLRLHDGSEAERIRAMRNELQQELERRLPDLIVNSATANRLPNTLNITIPGCKSDLMVMGLDMRGAAVSAGSACASGSVKFSHVLLAMGKGKEAASSSLRFSLGLGNESKDILPLAEMVVEVAASVRGLSSH